MEAADTLLRIKDVAAMCSVSTQTVRRWAARGILPPPVRIGGKSLFWHKADIVQWIHTTFQGGAQWTSN
jgi:predicted DNA-binding transcriptional regulator AlpA